MAYAKKISRALACLILFLLDDSGSMQDALPGTTDPKFAWVERLTGILLKELLTRSTEMKGNTVVVKPRYYVHVIRYGSRPAIWGEECMDIETAVREYTEGKNSLGLKGKSGGTDARAAFQMALGTLQKAIAEARFRDSFPPMVFHLTDGMSDTDPTQVAEKIKALATDDGNVLVVNGFIGTQTSLNYNGPDDFPGYIDAGEAGPSSDNICMFNMSSEAPDCIRQNLIDDGIFPNFREKSHLFFDVRTKGMLKHVIQVVGSLGSRADRQVR